MPEKINTNAEAVNWDGMAGLYAKLIGKNDEWSKNIKNLQAQSN